MNKNALRIIISLIIFFALTIVIYKLINYPWHIDGLTDDIKADYEYIYEEYFDLTDCMYDDKEICYKFKLIEGELAEVTEIISLVYQMITEKMWNEQAKFDEYTLSLSFYTSGGEFINFFDITSEKTDIRIVFNIYDDSIMINQIASMCPEVASVYVNYLIYEELSDFDDFTNLKSIHSSCTYRDKKVEKYIHQRFDDCKISWESSD